jgi:hypothetical protein
MERTCDQCRTTLPEGLTCEDLFYQGQALEIEQPARYAVHQLSVPCYMLQHNRYSRAGWLGARELLGQFLDGLAPADARQQNREKLDSAQRKFSITRGEKLAGVEAVKWTFNVGQVRLDTPEHYCADVRRWAACVLADSAALARTAGDKGTVK